MAGTILHCSLIVTEQPLLSTSVGCHLVSGLGTVGLMKLHVFFGFHQRATKAEFKLDKRQLKTCTILQQNGCSFN